MPCSPPCTPWTTSRKSLHAVIILLLVLLLLLLCGVNDDASFGEEYIKAASEDITCFKVGAHEMNSYSSPVVYIFPALVMTPLCARGGGGSYFVGV